MREGDFICADCGKPSPAAESETMAGKSGWRFTPRITPTSSDVEARCPECFSRYRASLAPQTPIWRNYPK